MLLGAIIDTIAGRKTLHITPKYSCYFILTSGYCCLLCYVKVKLRHYLKEYFLESIS